MQLLIVSLLDHLLKLWARVLSHLHNLAVLILLHFNGDLKGFLDSSSHPLHPLRRRQLNGRARQKFQIHRYTHHRRLQQPCFEIFQL